MMIPLVVASLLTVAPQGWGAAPPGAAAPQPGDTITLTLDEAIAMARRQSPNHIREQLDFDNDRLNWLEARAERFLPEVDLQITTPEYVSALRRVSGSDGSDRFVRTLRRTVEGELEITQPLPTGGSFSISGSLTALNQPNEDPEEQFSGATFLGFSLSQDFFGVNNRNRSYRVSRESWIRSQTQFLESERGLAENVIEEYYDLVQALKEASIDSVLFVRDSIRNAERQAAAGPSTMLDSLRIEGEAARSALNRIRSRQSLAFSRASFNEMLSLPPNTVVIPDTVVRFDRSPVDVEEGLEYARANRLDLRLSELSVENRRASLKDARKTSPIRVAVNGTMGFDGSAEALSAGPAVRDALNNQDKSTRIQLSVSIPLFDRFNERYSVLEAQNSLRMSELSFDEQRRELENEVRLAAQELSNAILQLELAEKQFDLTRLILAGQTEAYNAGDISSQEFLLDQTEAREAEIDLLEAQVEVLLAREEWKRVIGVPPFPDSRPVTGGAPR